MDDSINDEVGTKSLFMIHSFILNEFDTDSPVYMQRKMKLKTNLKKQKKNHVGNVKYPPYCCLDFTRFQVLLIISRSADLQKSTHLEVFRCGFIQVHVNKMPTGKNISNSLMEAMSDTHQSEKVRKSFPNNLDISVLRTERAFKTVFNLPTCPS